MDSEFEEFVDDAINLLKQNMLETYGKYKSSVEDIARLHQYFHGFTEAFPELKWARYACRIFAASGLSAMADLLEMAYFGLRYFIEQVAVHTKCQKSDRYLEGIYYLLYGRLSKIVHGEAKPEDIADYRDASVVAVWLCLSKITLWNPYLLQEAAKSRMYEHYEEENEWLLQEVGKVLEKWGLK
jgi:hypothetical protein